MPALVGGTSVLILVVRAISRDMSRGSYGVRKSLGTFLLMSGTVSPWPVSCLI